MKTSKDVFARGGGGTPPCAEITSCALPEIQSHPDALNTQFGVSTFCGSYKDVQPHWYALRCTYGREKKAYEYFLEEGIKSFYPTITYRKKIDGQNSLIEESRLPNIFFAFGTFDVLKHYVYDNVHDVTKHLRFYYNHHHDGTKEPLIVPDRQIQSLKLICESEIEDILLKPFMVEKFLKGQHVKVNDGPFAGVEGVIARFQGQQRVGISIEGLLTVATAYVPTAFIERVNTAK